MSTTGTVIYDGSPNITQRNQAGSDATLVSSADYQDPEEVVVAYVAFILVNDSRRRLSLRVEGPTNRSFG